MADDVKLPYPYMGIAFDDLVVLFTEFGTGTVIDTGKKANDYTLGDFRKDWIMSS